MNITSRLNGGESFQTLWQISGEGVLKKYKFQLNISKLMSVGPNNSKLDLQLNISKIPAVPKQNTVISLLHSG